MTPQTIIREVTHGHIFCGLGGGAKGFNKGEARVGNLEAKFRCVGGIDNDPAAIIDFERLAGVKGTCRDLFSREQYVAFHGVEPGVDWREAVPFDIQCAFGGERPNILFLSAPCLPADGLVITETGPRAIKAIRAGDRVLTHKGRLREVTHVGRHRHQGKMHGFRLNGTVDRQWFTDEHPLWVRKVVRTVASGRKRKLGDAAFIAAKDVHVGDRVGFPVEKAVAGTAKAFVLGMGKPQEIVRGGKVTGRYRKPKHAAVMGRIRDLTEFAASHALWWLLGCYLGDGYRGKGERYEVNFCVGAAEGPLATRIRNALDFLGITHHDDASGGATNIKIRAKGKHLHTLCGAFGDGADKKRIPEPVMSLEDVLLDKLIEGYRDTDGSEQARRQMPKGNTLQARWKIASTSLQLLRDMQRLLLRRGTFAGIHHCWPGGPQTIMGREVQTKQRWELSARLDPKKRTAHEFADGAVWVRVREVLTRDADETVWNLSVKEDDTYCAPMMATHNCKGFSGLLAEKLSLTGKYQALNGLTLRGIWLALEAFKDDPVDLIVFENVPRIAKRGRKLLDQIVALLRAYGYVVAETTHDCGELGGLGQSRKRFLLVARHAEKVPPFLYEPQKRPLRGVGEIIGRLPVPGPDMVLPMHRMPSLQWKTWVRLAFVEAGADWRSLNRLNVAEGVLTDFGIAPDANWNNDVLGVRRWTEPSGTITSRGGPTNGRFAVADPRAVEVSDRGAYGVGGWQDPAATLTSQRSPGQGRFSVADPRVDGHAKSVQMGVGHWGQPAAVVKGDVSVGTGRYAVADPRPPGTPFNNIYRIVPWQQPSPAVAGPGGPAGGVAVADPRFSNWHPGASSTKMRVTRFSDTSGTVTGSQQVGSGALAVADPRQAQRDDYKQTKYRVTGFDEASGAVISASTTGNGAFAVADPRPEGLNERRENYMTGGHYGVVPWTEPSGAVPGHSKNNNGRWSVADPRDGEGDQAFALPVSNDRLICCIRALDGTWHRPFTTLELAALQGLADPEETIELHGLSDSGWRERIGNAVPPPAAAAIAGVMGRTLLMAWSGITFALSAEPIWVQPIAMALAVDDRFNGLVAA